MWYSDSEGHIKSVNIPKAIKEKYSPFAKQMEELQVAIFNFEPSRLK